MPSGKDSKDDEFYALYSGTNDGSWWIDEAIEKEKKEKEEKAQAVVRGNRKEYRGCECGVDSLDRAEDRNPMLHSDWCPVKKRAIYGY